MGEKRYRAIVRLYKNCCPRKSEIEWYREQPLNDCIQNAAFAKVNGKKHSHQHRLQYKNFEKAYKILKKNKEDIKNCKNFDDLYGFIEKLVSCIKGLGELYFYDTALRIGAHLGLSPTKIFLHRGTRVGAKNLGLDGKAKTLEVSKMPEAFQKLEPYEIEDLLCIFKDKLCPLTTTKN